MPPRRIVDTHQHFWDLGHLYYPWLTDRINPDYLQGDYLGRNYLPEDYRRETRNWNVEMTVHEEAECADGQQLRETEWVTAMHARSGLANAIMGHAWLVRPDLEDELRRHMQFPLFRGIRSKPRVGRAPGEVADGPGTMADPDWRRGLGVLQKLGLVYDFRVPYFALKDGADLPRRYPELQFVVVHTGVSPRDRSEAGLAIWRDGMQALAAAPNVAVKISGLSIPGQPWSVEVQRRVVLETIDLFGVDRCMFASNFPVDRAVTDFDTLLTNFDRIVSVLTEDERDRLYYRNAVKVYRPVARADVVPAPLGMG